MRAVSALLVPLAALALSCGGDEPSTGAGGSGATTAPSAPGAAAGIEGVEVERAGPYDHVLADLDYPRPVPSGGSHPPPPFWLTCGVYEGEIPEELAVHSLEHGAVWIALGPDATGADRSAAVQLAAGRKVIVSDVAGLANPVEAVAWEHRLVLDSADDQRLAAFLDEFIDGGTSPEAGASCTSVGSPPTPPPLPTG